MKKETKQILIGLGAIAVLYFLFKKKKPTSDSTPSLPGPSDPVSESVTTPESTSKDVDLDEINEIKSLNFANASGGNYSYQIVSSPNRGGTATLSGSILTYTPAKDFVGTESLGYRIVDSDGAFSNTATITFTVTAVYDGPQAKNLTETVQEDGTVTLDIQGSGSQSPDGFAGSSSQTQSKG
tara:strand:- start:6551 stop:7096 length:546 start_codon:yes stop_codon:yes gene_type:complete